MNEFAIVVVGYNRVQSISRLLKSLNNAFISERITLIISIDNSGKDDVVKVAEAFEWKFGEKKVLTYPKRLGLKKHVLLCGDLTEQYENLLVLEDDLFVSPYFMDYVKACIEKYKDDDRIAGIGLYNNVINQNTGYKFEAVHDGYDVYFMRYACSWGQIWTRDKWRAFKNWYIKNAAPFNNLANIPHNVNRWDERSWLKYHVRYCEETNKYFVYPRISITTNFSDSGSHSEIGSNFFQTSILMGEKKWILCSLDESNALYDAFFENIQLSKRLSISSDEIAIDLYGARNEDQLGSKRYWLTTKSAPYKIIGSYGMSMKPRDANILNHIKGEEIYLYDLSQQIKTKRFDTRFMEMQYYIGSINTRDLLWYALANLWQRVILKVKRKIRK